VVSVFGFWLKFGLSILIVLYSFVVLLFVDFVLVLIKKPAIAGFFISFWIQDSLFESQALHLTCQSTCHRRKV